jgi:hypothetical protein
MFIPFEVEQYYPVVLLQSYPPFIESQSFPSEDKQYPPKTFLNELYLLL